MNIDYEWLKAYTEKQLEEMHMHSVSGKVDTMEGWVYSFQEEELEESGLTLEEAWGKALYDTLYPVEMINGEWLAKKY